MLLTISPSQLLATKMWENEMTAGSFLSCCILVSKYFTLQNIIFLRVKEAVKYKTPFKISNLTTGWHKILFYKVICPEEVIANVLDFSPSFW